MQGAGGRDVCGAVASGSPLWSSGEERGWSLDKETGLKRPNQPGYRGIRSRGKCVGVLVLLG